MEKYLYTDLYHHEKSHWWHITKRYTVLKLIKKHIKISKPKILDMGCGTGYNVETWNTIGSGYGVDISSEAIVFCKKRGLKHVYKSKGEHTPFPKRSFDAVTLLDVLEHIAKEDIILKEIQRVLKPNGILICTVPAFSALWSDWDIVLHHKRRYTKKSLTSVLLQNGFSLEFISYQYSFLFIPILIFRKIKSFFNQKDSYQSDFSYNNFFLNNIFITLYFLERLYATSLPVPFGTTVVCVAKKNAL